MKKLITLLAILFIPLLMLGQINTFDLSSYKLPDMSLHQLNLNLNLNGQNTTSERHFAVINDSYLNFNGIGGNIDLQYLYYKNSERFQLNQRADIYYSSSYSDYKDKETLLQENYSHNGFIDVISENRFYFKPNRFIEADLYYTGDMLISNQKNFPSTDEYSTNEINIETPILVGFGRVEQIQDCRLALYIFDELNKLGILARNPTEEEILKFSQFISERKKERFFDSRLKNMKDIELVDSALQSIGLISNIDSKYYVTLNDQWNYAAQPIRNAGQRISIGIKPEIYSSNYKNKFDNGIGSTYESIENRYDYAIGAGVNCNYEKPINLYWQNSLDFSFFGKLMDGNIEDWPYNVKLESPQLESNIDYTLGFYPNTRTSLRLSLSIYYFNAFGQEKINEMESIKINHLLITPSASLLINYYISQKIKINISYSLFYSYIETDSEYYAHLYNDYMKYNYLNQSLKIGFIYQIF